MCPNDKAHERSVECPALRVLDSARRFCGTENRGTEPAFNPLNAEFTTRKRVYAHSAVHTEPIYDGEGEEAGLDGKRQGKLGNDRVLSSSCGLCDLAVICRHAP